MATGNLVPVDDGSVTVVFEATTVSGTAGCNGFNGPWTLSRRHAGHRSADVDQDGLRAGRGHGPRDGGHGRPRGLDGGPRRPDGGIDLLDATGAVRLTLAVDQPLGAPVAHRPAA